MNSNHEPLNFSQHPERSEDEWKSLIQSGAFGTDFKPTEEYLNSATGQAVQADEEKLYRNSEIIGRRIANIRDQVKTGHMTQEEADTSIDLLKARQEELLNAAIKKADDSYKEYVEELKEQAKDRIDAQAVGRPVDEWVDSPEVQHLSRKEIEKLGAAAMQAANVGPVNEPPIPDAAAQTDSQAPDQDQLDQQPDATAPDAQADQNSQPATPHKIELLAQQLNAGKASVINEDEELRRGVLRRIQQDLANQQSTNQAQQSSGDQAQQNSADQAGNQSSSDFSPELKQAMADHAKELAELRDQGLISDSEYDAAIKSDEIIFRARQRAADAAKQNAADQAQANQAATDAARQAAADQAAQQARDQAQQQAQDAAAQAAANQASTGEQDDSQSFVERFKERFRQMPGAKKFLTIVGAAAGTFALSALLTFGAFSVANAANQNSAPDTNTGTPAAAQAANSDSTTIHDLISEANAATRQAAEMEAALAAETDANHNVLTGYEVYDNLIDGSFTQYDNPGCSNSEGKSTPNDVANPRKVLELIGKTPETASPEEWGAAYEYVAYCQAEPAAHMATSFNMAGFEGLDYTQATNKIKSMNPEEKAAFQSQLKNVFDQINFGIDTADGTHVNFYIANGGPAMSTNEFSGETVLQMTMENPDGSQTIAEVMVACFNGDKVVLMVNLPGEDTPTVVAVPINTDNTSNIGAPNNDTSPEKQTPPKDDGPEGEAPSDDKPEPEEEIKQKDSANLERIDESNDQNMAENNGSQETNNYENSGIGQDEKTEAPTSESFGETEASIDQNESAPAAETVSDQDHSENAGGAHEDEDQGRQANDAAQEAADNRGNTEATPTVDELDQMLQNARQNQS